MIEIDFILGSKYVSPGGRDDLYVRGLVLLVAKSVLANRGIVLGIMAWNVLVQLDDGGENS